MASPATRKQRGVQRSVLKPLNLYERAMQQKKDKELKIISIKSQMMEECTFTPKTTKSNSSSRTATTNTSSGGDTVFDRLYRSGESVSSKMSTPLKSNCYRGRPSLSGRSTASRTSTCISNRMEQIYEEGVRKMRDRPINDKEEKKIRDRRREEKEIDECTFRPKLYWGQRAITSSKQSHKSKIVMEPKPIRKHALVRRSKQLAASGEKPPISPPREIVIPTRPRKTFQPWESPFREQNKEAKVNTMAFMPVSPLRDPSFDDCDGDVTGHALNKPRVMAICWTVATESIAMSQAQETEYGSI